MILWVAISSGSLDFRTDDDVSSISPELAINSIYPAVASVEPIGLRGTAAELWLKLVQKPMDDDTLTVEEQTLVREFEKFGIASRSLGDPFRTRNVSRPWLSSPLHELAYGLLVAIARKLEIEVLFIKGPILQRQGLRDRHHSGDIDVLLRESDINRFCQELQKYGWSLMPDVWEGTTVNHSITMGSHPWACEVDVHRYMPGCFTANDRVFDIVMKGATTMDFASNKCRIPNAETNVVLYALHETRPQFDRQISSSTIQHCADNFRRYNTKSLDIAREMGALESLFPVISIICPEIEYRIKRMPPVNWRWRRQPNRIMAYLLALKMLPIRQRIPVFLRIIWPEKNVVDLTNNNDKLKSKYKHLPARISRLMRGMRANRS